MIDSLFSGANYLATKQLLDVTAMRHSALASNIANVETPGYKRLDLAKTFQSQLKESIARGDRHGIKAAKASLAVDQSAASMRADGNTVQIDKELLEMNGNSANYEVLTQFASSSLKRLKMAITGREVS
jgi:flagellar basal-body rod protein FlgB